MRTSSLAPPLMLFRLLARRSTRWAPALPGMGWARRQAMRIPFSRFSRLASWCFWGIETIRWRNVHVRVNPGEIHGYYPYFFGGYADEEIDYLVKACHDARV